MRIATLPTIGQGKPHPSVANSSRLSALRHQYHSGSGVSLVTIPSLIGDTDMWIKTENGWRPFACPSAVLSPATLEPVPPVHFTAHHTADERKAMLDARADWEAEQLALVTAAQANAYAARLAHWNEGN